MLYLTKHHSQQTALLAIQSIDEMVFNQMLWKIFVDTVDMTLYAAFHLGLYCLQKQPCVWFLVYK